MRLFAFAPSALAALYLALSTYGADLHDSLHAWWRGDEAVENQTAAAPIAPIEIAAADRKVIPELPKTTETELKVGRGDTLMGLLTEAQVPQQEAAQAIKALSAHYNPRNLKVGQSIRVAFEGGEDSPIFTGLYLEPSPALAIAVERTDADFAATRLDLPLDRMVSAASVKIDTSLFGAGRTAGMPAEVMAQIVRLYAYDIDFQRDIQPGDRVDVLYEQAAALDGSPVGAPLLLYVALTTGGKTRPLYRHEFEDGEIDYFDLNGQSVRKALLRTPIDGARISSGFGMRRHPILGYSKMHKGVDFAAPRGTPIYAAGDGVIERANWFGAYGNYVKVKHNNEFATAYGHLSRFADGIRPGKRVRQGQVIGYVGSTGRSTGPHLHYEILRAGAQVNPASIKMPSGRTLEGAALTAFKSQVESKLSLWASLNPGTRVASRIADASAR
jgi:murein DD-endopeptidase MepM/ murein hydrolase activator NlpD